MKNLKTVDDFEEYSNFGHLERMPEQDALGAVFSGEAILENFKAEIILVPRDPNKAFVPHPHGNDNSSPQFQIRAVKNGKTMRLGSAWLNTDQLGGPYLSCKFFHKRWVPIEHKLNAFPDDLEHQPKDMDYDVNWTFKPWDGSGPKASNADDGFNPFTAVDQPA